MAGTPVWQSVFLQVIALTSCQKINGYAVYLLIKPKLEVLTSNFFSTQHGVWWSAIFSEASDLAVHMVLRPRTGVLKDHYPEYIERILSRFKDRMLIMTI